MYLLITIPCFKGRPFDSNHVIFVHKFNYFYVQGDICLYLFVAAPNNIFRLPTYPWRGSSHFVVLNFEVLDLKFQIWFCSILNYGSLSQYLAFN